MLKTKVKFLLAISIVFFALCLFNTNTVNAVVHTDTSKWDVKVPNEIEKDLIFDLNGANEDTIYLELDPFKLWSLSKDTNKLDTLVKSDNKVYQDVYVGIQNNVIEVVNTDNNSNLEITQIDNKNYVKIEVAILYKTGSTYIPVNQENKYNLQLKDINGELTEMTINATADTTEAKGYNSWLEIVDENNNYIGSEEYYLNGQVGASWPGGSTTAVYTAYDYYGDYYKLSLSVNVGNTITIDKIGTLTYVGTEVSNKLDTPTTMYVYKKKITDTSLLSKAQGHNLMIELVDFQTNQGAYNYIYFTVIGEARQTYAVNDESKNIGISLTAATDVGVSLKADTINENDNTYIEMKNSITNNKNYIWISAYDIKLVGGNYEGELVITFDLGTENDGKTVYIVHKKYDGSFEDFKSIVENGKVTIKVDELSPFLIGYEKTEQLENTATNETLKDEKDNTPKTGITSNAYPIIFALISILAVGTIALIKNK